MLNPFFEKTSVGQFHEIILHICFNSLFHSKLHNNGLVLYQCLSKGVGISSTLPHQIKNPIFIEAKVNLTSKNEECKIKIVSIDFIINLFLPFLLFITYMLMKKYQGTFQKYLTQYALSLRAAGQSLNIRGENKTLITQIKQRT